MKLLDLFFDAYDKVYQSIRPSSPNQESSGLLSRLLPVSIIAILLLQLVLSFLWGSEPDRIDPVQAATQLAAERNEPLTTGYITTAALITVSETLLNKRGGYLSNDVLPPSLFMDNIPNWEFGVLTQVRDLSLALRNDISRSQSQSIEDKDIIAVENQFRIDSNSWMLPPAESEYRKAISGLTAYLARLSDNDTQDAQFYARADNLNDWLSLITKRLGSLSQRLSASVGQARINTDLAGDAEASQSTPTSKIIEAQTPWFEIDDVFYEARGSAWALSILLRAVEADFRDILQKKNAQVSVQQIIRELEATQDTVWSPVILNGGGFGIFANHSLVMANYISRANAAVIDLQQLLKQG